MHLLALGAARVECEEIENSPDLWVFCTFPLPQLWQTEQHLTRGILLLRLCHPW